MVHRRRSAFVARQIGQHAFHFMSSTFVPFHLLTGGRRESPSLPSEAVVLVAAGCTHLRVGSLAHRNLSPTLLRILSLFSGCRARHFLFHHLRSEEHTSELQSPCNLVCRLLLEKNKPGGSSKPRLSQTTVKSLYTLKFVEMLPPEACASLFFFYKAECRVRLNSSLTLAFWD